MRAAFTLFTMAATLLHFAVGCCGHLSHLDGDAVCCSRGVASEVAVECCTDHDPGHDHESEPVLSCLNAAASIGNHGEVIATASIDDCGGCTCVAKIEKDLVDGAAPAVSSFVTSFESKAIVTIQLAVGPCEAWDPPVPSELRPPLFERLVV